jgi:hypothetical protein
VSFDFARLLSVCLYVLSVDGVVAGTPRLHKCPGMCWHRVHVLLVQHQHYTSTNSKQHTNSTNNNDSQDGRPTGKTSPALFRIAKKRRICAGIVPSPPRAIAPVTCNRPSTCNVLANAMVRNVEWLGSLCVIEYICIGCRAHPLCFAFLRSSFLSTAI